MSEDFNIITKARRFSEVVENPKAISVFLSIAINKVRNYEQLYEDTGLELAELAPLVKRLQEGGFIKPNPNPLSNKFKLAFTGQLFAEQLKIDYPEIKELLGEQSLITPIKIKSKVQDSNLSSFLP